MQALKSLIIVVIFIFVFSIDVFSKEDISNYKFVDDFNSGQYPNMIGGCVFYDISPNASLKSEHYSENKENIYGKKGYSLKIDYDIPAGEFAKLGMNLNELDISKADKICFWVKGTIGNEIFNLLLDDGQGHKEKVFIDKVSQKWSKIEITLSDFKTINFGHMNSLVLDFSIEDYDNKGIIYIDNIAFFSTEPDLFARSLMDNIADFPEKKLESKEKIQELINISDNKKFMLEIAKDTWNFFENIIDQNTNLVLDSIDVKPDKIQDFTSLTNIGLYMMSVVSAYDFNFITKEIAIKKVQDLLTTLEKLPRWKSLWYNFYSTTNLQIARHYISTVDNGWLSAGFIIVRNAFPELYDRISVLLSSMDYSVLYDNKLGQFALGYDTRERSMSPYHYGLICTEPRLTSFIAIGKGDVKKKHWYRMYRTLPNTWDWQDQIPKGVLKKQLGIKYFQGYYSYLGIDIVPSWGGSLFEFLMPTLVMKEKELGVNGLGLNNERAVNCHIKFAQNKGYPVWGFSPCSTPDNSNGGYSEFGVKGMGSKSYNDRGVVTPHVSFLALHINPEAVIQNLKTMLKLYNIYGEYGFYDSVNVNDSKVSYKYLALDQGMSFVSMNNYINNGIIRERFHNDIYIKKNEDLLIKENFFNNE